MVHTRRQRATVSPEQTRRDRAIRDAGARVYKTFPQFAVRKRPRGMNNPSNYCYRRSIMQALVHTPQILRYMASHNPQALPQCAECPPAALGPCAACYLKKYMLPYFTSAQANLNAAVHRFDAEFANVLWPQMNTTAMSSSSLRNNQQDAQEFLQFIGSALHRATGGNTKPIRQPLYNALFTVAQRSHWICPNCNVSHISPSPPEFGQYITVNQPARHRSVQQYIDWEYRAPGEAVTVTCTTCGVTGINTRRKTDLLGAPEVLFVALRCFDWTRVSANGQPVKIKSNVTINDQLDLTGCQPAAQQGLHELKYELKHVIYHVGGSVRGGHYYGRYSTPAGIFGLNDSGVTPVGSLGKFSENDSTMPYVIVYSRVGN